MTKQDNAPLDIIAENVALYDPTRSDITFTHSVFAQCFLPLRKLKNNAKSYEIKHGRASLAIDAGRLLDPNTGDLIKQEVPYGAAARVILAHIHNHIIRAGSQDEAQEIPMGESLRDFFKTYRLNVTGPNGKQITQQVNNIAAAHITIGVWNDNQAKQINVPTLAEEINFWLEKDDRQRTLWQPKMIINQRYVETIRERKVPLDIRALIGLYEKPRAMDVFTWLSYRLPLVREKKGIYLPYEGQNGLHGIFGATIKDKSMFKIEFEKTLKEVARWYPDARLSIEPKGIRIYQSPSPVPAAHSISNSKSHFFVNNS